MLAQVLGGISTVIAFSMGSLLAAAMGGTAFGGAGTTLTTLGAAAFAIPLAGAVLRRGRRHAMTLGMGIGLAGSVLAFIAAQLWSLPLLLVGFLLLGAATAVGMQARFAAAECATAQTQARALALVVWASTIGGVAGPNLLPVATRLSSAVGAQEHSGAYLICIAAQALAVVVLWFGMGAAPRQGTKPQINTAAGQGAAPRRVALAGRLRVIILALAVAHFSMVAIMSMTPVHLHHHGSSLQLVGLTISLHVAGMYALAPVFGYLADKVGALWLLVAGYLTIAACCAVLVLWPANHAAVVVALILLGLGWSCAFVSSSAMLVAAATEDTRTFAQGRSDLCTNIAGALGGILAGPMISAWGMPTLACGVGIVIIIVGLGVSRSLRAPDRRPPAGLPHPQSR